MTCAILPAAGRGTRLGAGEPKVFLDLAPGISVWEFLVSQLSPHVDHIHTVLAPEAMERGRTALSKERAAGPRLSLSAQDSPRGMGDAIFGARDAWEGAETLLVVWGDQASLSSSTILRTLAAHRAGPGPRLTIPLATVDHPYVHYVFDPKDELIAVRQSREGDARPARGESDVGVFCLSTAHLASEWDAYQSSAPPGSVTGEANFLPFLPHLARRGFRASKVVVTDPGECRGINTPEDLAYFRDRMSRLTSGS